MLFGLAIWFMRRELVPIEHLGVAADALGKGRDVPDFAFAGGTREVRNAATAFQHHAHPAAPLDPAAHRDAGRRQPRPAHAAHPHEARRWRCCPNCRETRELADDVADMERMIEGYLAFARGEGDEDPIAVDLSEHPRGRGAPAARRDNADMSVSWTRAT